MSLGTVQVQMLFNAACLHCHKCVLCLAYIHITANDAILKIARILGIIAILNSNRTIAKFKIVKALASRFLED